MRHSISHNPKNWSNLFEIYVNFRFKISFRIEAKSSEIQDRIRERERYRLNFAFLLSRANSIDSRLSSVHFIAVIFRAEPAPFRMSMSRFFWSVSPNQLYFTLRHRCLWYDLTSSVSFFLPSFSFLKRNDISRTVSIVADFTKLSLAGRLWSLSSSFLRF